MFIGFLNWKVRYFCNIDLLKSITSRLRIFLRGLEKVPILRTRCAGNGVGEKRRERGKFVKGRLRRGRAAKTPGSEASCKFWVLAPLEIFGVGKTVKSPQFLRKYKKGIKKN